MEGHQELLKYRCRLANCSLKRSLYCCDKMEFKDEFLKLFQIDLSFDVESVHPPFICEKHKKLLTYARQALSKNRSYVTTVVPYQFTEHGENGCSYCDSCWKETGLGRPKKRSGRPGARRKFDSTVEEMEVDKAEQRSDAVDKCIDDFKKLGLLDCQEYIDKIIPLLLPSEIESLSYAIGKSESRKVLEEAKSFQNVYKNVQNLENIDIKQYIMNANPKVVKFLHGVCDLDSKSDQRTQYLLARTVESIYKLRHGNIIYPLAFLNNLSIYVERGCRNIIELNGAGTGGGQYQSVVSWLKDQSTEELPCPAGDIGHVFDNNQVIGKTWSVRPNNKVKQSVVTTHAILQLNASGNLEKKSEHLPFNWLNLDNFEAKVLQIRNLKDPYFKELDKLHYEQTYFFINSAIESVLTEQRLEGKHDKNDDNSDKSKEPSFKIS